MQYIIPIIALLVAGITFFNISSKANAQQVPDINQAQVVVAEKTKAQTSNKTLQKQHTATASYLTPRRKEHKVEVTLKLDGSTITDADINYDGGKANTPSHSAFDKAYKGEVVGKNIQDVSLSRVGGASLTSDAFNQAVQDIRKKL